MIQGQNTAQITKEQPENFYADLYQNGSEVSVFPIALVLLVAIFALGMIVFVYSNHLNSWQGFIFFYRVK